MKQHRRVPTAESFELWFNREIAELDAGLTRLAGSVPRTPTRVRSRAGQRKRVNTEAKKFMGVAAKSVRKHNPVASSDQVTGSPALPSPPAGTDLSNPKSFGLVPPTAELERGMADDDQFRQWLVRHIAFATEVLHTSGVSAAVWRQWRVFEKVAHQRLRELTARPAEDGNDIGIG